MDLGSIVDACALLGAGIAMGVGAVGSGVGEGYTAREAVLGMSRQPAMTGPVLRTMLIGQAVCETAGIFSLVIAVMLLFKKTPSPSLPKAAALLGAGLSMGLSALGSGVGSGFPSAAACKSVARNPDSLGRVTMNMLLGQAMATGGAIFGFVIAIILVTLPGSDVGLTRTCAALAAGLCMGLGAIGPGLGIGIVGYKSCEAIGNNLECHRGVNNALLLGSAVAQSPGVFALVVAMILCFVH
jgi:ATP synthase F0 subunit c